MTTMTTINPIVGGVIGVALAAAVFNGSAATLSFEPPLPGGLAAVSFYQGTFVEPNARITDQFANLGIVMSKVALVNVGSGHLSSGVIGIGGYSPDYTVDYDVPMTFTFVSPGDGATPATTDYFAIKPDLWNHSDNSATVSAYGIGGELLGTVTYQELGYSIPETRLLLSGLGQIHHVVIDATLHNPLDGGIAFDDLEFGAVVVPEPNAVSFLASGIGLLIFNCRRRPKSRRHHAE